MRDAPDITIVTGAGGWFGRALLESSGAAPFAFDFAEEGGHTLTALADTGAWSAVVFRVMP